MSLHDTTLRLSIGLDLQYNKPVKNPDSNSQERGIDRTHSFGYWLRRRNALDLTQAALAQARIHAPERTVDEYHAS